MTVTKHRVLTLATLLLGPAGAFAAPAAPAARKPLAPPDFSQADARRAMSAFAECIVGSEPIATRRLLVSRPRSPQERDALSSFSVNHNACVQRGGMWGARLSGTTTLMRGALFEASYRRRFATEESIPSGGGTATPTVERAKMPAATADEFDYLYAVAGCAIKQKPAEARALIMAPVETPQEQAALAALTPAIGACIPPDRKLALDRPLLRAVVAETLYDWSAASAAVTASAR